MSELKCISIQIDAELHKKLRILAIEKGVTLKDYLISLIEIGAK